jgi:tyrosine-specific transport protein
MQKQLRAIFILSGTAIGSGMISLPIVLAHIGIIPSIFLMGICAFITYISALIRTELNLHSDCRFTLERVGLEFSGKHAAFIGNISLRLLQFALLAAYICGLSSIMGMESIPLKCCVSLGIFILLSISSNKIIGLNQKLFIALLVVTLGAIICMLLKINFTQLPHNANEILLPKLCLILPTLFTSFGFQGSLHSITKFCNNDPKLIKIACFWGSFIPAFLYIAWVVGVITLIFNTHPDLFLRMVSNGIDVNELINALSSVSSANVVKCTVFIISVLAIVTSVIGVGLALVDDLGLALESFNATVTTRIARWTASAISVIPAVLVAIFIPGAFIKVLSFAGMILAVIAIFLPTFLFFKLKESIKFKILNRKEFIVACVIFGIVIVVCELMNLVV